MAGLRAMLYRVGRSAERLPVDRASTLRGHDGDPVDVTIEDLSVTGCRLTTPVIPAIDENVMIGLAGVGIRNARVVWSNEDQIGCSFHTPLSDLEIQKTQSAQTVADGHFPTLPTPPAYLQDEIDHSAGFSPRARLAIIGGLTVASWVLLGAIAILGYMIFAN